MCLVRYIYLHKEKKLKFYWLNWKPIIVYQMHHEEQCFNAREFAWLYFIKCIKLDKAAYNFAFMAIVLLHVLRILVPFCIYSFVVMIYMDLLFIPFLKIWWSINLTINPFYRIDNAHPILFICYNMWYFSHLHQVHTSFLHACASWHRTQ